MDTRAPGKLAWIARLRVPVLIMLVSIGGWAGAEYLWPDSGYVAATLIASRFLTIIAIGWAVTSLTDLAIKRRISRLDMK